LTWKVRLGHDVEVHPGVKCVLNSLSDAGNQDQLRRDHGGTSGGRGMASQEEETETDSGSSGCRRSKK